LNFILLEYLFTYKKTHIIHYVHSIGVKAKCNKTVTCMKMNHVFAQCSTTTRLISTYLVHGSC